MAYTSDRGLTWNTAATSLPANTGIYLKGLAFRDANNGLAYTGSDSYIGAPDVRQVARTSDGGRTWTVLSTLWPADITAIAACPSSTGAYYVGAGYTVTYPVGVNHATIAGIVAASTDDGASWQTLLGDDISYYRIAIGDNGQL